MLSTLWMPSLNPVGEPSIWAAGIVSVVGLLASGWVIRLPEGLRRVLVAVAPWCFLLLACATEGSILHRWARAFPNADDRVAEMIYLVCGFALGLEGFRFLRLRYRLNGAILTYIFGAILVYHLARVRVRWYDASPLLYAAIPLFVIVWTPIILRLNRLMGERFLASKGLCIKCAYDLRGNQSGICPECGRRFREEGQAGL